jgi:hypothetical protein
MGNQIYDGADNIFKEEIQGKLAERLLPNIGSVVELLNDIGWPEFKGPDADVEEHRAHDIETLKRIKSHIRQWTVEQRTRSRRYCCERSNRLVNAIMAFRSPEDFSGMSLDELQKEHSWWHLQVIRAMDGSNGFFLLSSPQHYVLERILAARLDTDIWLPRDSYQNFRSSGSPSGSVTGTPEAKPPAFPQHWLLDWVEHMTKKSGP